MKYLYALPVFSLVAARNTLVEDLSQLPNYEVVKQAQLDLHNKYRSDLATGQTFPGVYARNIQRLSWDDELAQQAQDYANTCQFKHPDIEAGENLAYRWHWSTSDVVNNAESGEQPLTQWFSETEYLTGQYDLTNPANTNFQGVIWGNAGHYTAMTWASTTRLGCGMARCTTLSSDYSANGYVHLNDGFQAIITVCRYLEAGNSDSVFFDRTFDQNEIAASCDNSSEGLCVSGNDVNADSDDQEEAPVISYDDANSWTDLDNWFEDESSYDAHPENSQENTPEIGQVDEKPVPEVQAEPVRGQLNRYWSFEYDLKLTNPDVIRQAGKEWAVISRLENANDFNSDFTRYPALFFRSTDNHAYIAHIPCDSNDWAQQRTAYNFITLVPGETYRFKITMAAEYISFYINDQGWSYPPGEFICLDGRDVVLSTFGGNYSEAYYQNDDWAEITNVNFVNF